MIDNNWTSGASIVGRDSNGDCKVHDITANLFQGGSGAFPSGLTAGGSNITGSSTINNLTVTGSFNAAAGTNFGGNADTATTATHVNGTSGCVLYQSGNNQTTTDNDLKFNGNKLTVKDFECTGSFTANISALVPTLAQNVAGSGGRVLYNSSTNNTSDSGNLTFDGTNLSCGGNITAYSSDIRLKTEIHTIENAVAKVCMLSLIHI